MTGRPPQASDLANDFFRTMGFQEFAGPSTPLSALLSASSIEHFGQLLPGCDAELLPSIHNLLQDLAPQISGPIPGFSWRICGQEHPEVATEADQT
eukprot:CAMPEP_0198657468 /NCGR_PEP_ID=MMETSP1467-20131203/16521_1 /TAXON_ID=1462469 /ORGANISM="unid. sp., Strain CCMP2135" /LENGTH=95 /DNA_ID=CAMNT_0044393651 /DNA_START=8 /DNA_END=292 /DNA_ORIENTATION=+